MKTRRGSQRGFLVRRMLLGLSLLSIGLFLGVMGASSSSVSVKAIANDSLVVAAKIAPEVSTDLSGNSSASVILFLSDQADLNPAYQIKDHAARGWFVYNTLTQHAARKQAGLVEMLRAEGVSFQSFWVANMIVVRADRSLV